jgi:hypothetical protein
VAWEEISFNQIHQDSLLKGNFRQSVQVIPTQKLRLSFRKASQNAKFAWHQKTGYNTKRAANRRLILLQYTVSSLVKPHRNPTDDKLYSLYLKFRTLLHCEVAGQSGDRIQVRDGFFRTRPNRPWVPPSFLCNRYRVFHGGNTAGAWRWPPHLAPRLKKE